MNIPQKIVLIFWLVGVATAQDPLEGSGTDTTTLEDASTFYTTQAPEGPGYTTDASTFTTQAPEGPGDTTDASTFTTRAPDGPGYTTDASTFTTQGPCTPSSCLGDSRCEERHGGSFVCICWPGLVYRNTSGCTQTKVFPSSLTLNRTFQSEMNDKMSEVFQTTALDIEDQLNQALKEDGYIYSTVLSLHEGSITAEVQTFYELTSNATKESIEAKIRDAAGRGIIKEFKEFNQSSVCSLGTCDKTTSVCKEVVSGTATCTCTEGYIISQSTSQACLACPNGEKAVGREKCEKCPFGFAGFNCNDPYLLVVVVVSTVLGAFLIITLVALIVVSCSRNQKESSSSKVDLSSNYGNMELHKPTGVPRIPRANPHASWNSNNMEMTNSGSNQALVTRDRPESKAHYSEYEDVSYERKVTPAYSSYGGKGVENGGVQNPYFRRGDDSMRRY